MKVASYGRIAFGASAVLFGVIGLMWYDAETWQTLAQIWKLPFGTIIGGCLMTLQIAGGIALQSTRNVRLGAIALYAATQASSVRAVVLGRLARLGLGVCAISFALSQVLYRRDTAALVPKWIPPNQMFWAILTTIAF